MAYTVHNMVSAKLHLPKFDLRKFNNFLTFVVAVLALYIIAVPYLPQFAWWLRHDSPIQTLITKEDSPATAAAADQVVEGDKLFIPRMDLEQPIWGGSKANLERGVWLVQGTSTPDKGGNTVLVGHRFTYKNPAGVFYHLDKVQHGDVITVHWQGKVYEYKVTEIKVVPATEVSVEDNTPEPQLTVYTCTPLWSVENRLVVIAKPLPENRE